MLRWLSDAFDGLRRTLDFPRYEAALKAEHLVMAQRRYSSVDLRREVDQLMAPVTAEVQARFEPRIEAHNRDLALLAAEMQAAQRHLAVLERPYKDELAQLHSEKKDRIAARQGAQERVDSAHADLRAARAALDRWYAKSESGFPIWGNGGKRLPKRSVIWQSTGDRDSLKADRDAAGAAIGRHTRERDALHEKVKRVDAKIAAVKEARQEKFDLQRAGITGARVRRTMEGVHLQVTWHHERKAKVQADRAEFVLAARHRLGIAEREAAIARIDAQRADFEATFDTAAARAGRKFAHAAQWAARKQQPVSGTRAT